MTAEVAFLNVKVNKVSPHETGPKHLFQSDEFFLHRLHLFLNLFHTVFVFVLLFFDSVLALFSFELHMMFLPPARLGNHLQCGRKAVVTSCALGQCAYFGPGESTTDVEMGVAGRAWLAITKLGNKAKGESIDQSIRFYLCSIFQRLRHNTLHSLPWPSLPQSKPEVIVARKDSVEDT